MSCNLIVLTTSLSHGGAEKHGVLLADYFKNEKKWNVDFVVFREGTGYLRNRIENSNIKITVLGEVSHFNESKLKKEIKVKAKLLAKFKPTYIISLNREANIFSSFVWKASGAQGSFWSQQSTYDNEGMTEKQIEAMRNMTGFLSNSQHGLTYIQESFKIPKEKGCVIYNGYERSKDVNSNINWRSQLGINETAFCAFMVGHIAARKDHWTLIKSWPLISKKLKASGVESKLILAGDFGNDTCAMVEYCLEHGVYNDVKFLGRFKHVFELNQEVDLGVLSSHREGMPNVLVEQMISGLPVVVSDIPGNLEAIGPNNKEFAFEYKNENDLCDKVVKFALDKSLCKSVGANNQKYATNMFSIDKLGRETESAIKRLIEK